MEEKKPTDEEIIKALENNLGFGTEHTSMFRICFAAADLINRQKAKIERLTEEKWQVQDDLDNYHAMYQEEVKAKAELQKQVDELKDENGKLVTIGNGFALERNNLREELDELKKSGNGVLLTSLYKKQADDHKRGLSVQRAYWKKKLQQAEKDTAPVAINRFINQLYIDGVLRDEGDLDNELRKVKAFVLKKYYGVEVE